MLPEWIPRAMDHPPVDDRPGPEVALELDRADDLDPFHPDSSADEGEGFEAAISLEELAASLEEDAGEDLAVAIEGLASIEPEIRVRIIAGLGELPRGPGLSAFLRALGQSPDPATARAASLALEEHPDPEPSRPAPEWLPALRPAESRSPSRHHLVGSLVSAVDGEGRATIALSASRGGRCRSAVFRCDVLRGVVHAFGRVEDESPEATGLIGETLAAMSPECDRLLDVPELAMSLLSGTLLLGLGGGRQAGASVESWVAEVLGADFRPRPIPIPKRPGPPDREPWEDLTGPGEKMRRAEAVLDGCPAWLDTSPLTMELAEELELREGGGRRTDPTRHAGAYRYLFEHRLIHRLDLYGRMLLWMAWFWRFAREPALADSAVAIADEFADAQFAVPSHPFTVALTTRSLDDARRRARAGRG